MKGGHQLGLGTALKTSNTRGSGRYHSAAPPIAPPPLPPAPPVPPPLRVEPSLHSQHAGREDGAGDRGQQGSRYVCVCVPSGNKDRADSTCNATARHRLRCDSQTRTFPAAPPTTPSPSRCRHRGGAGGGGRLCVPHRPQRGGSGGHREAVPGAGSCWRGRAPLRPGRPPAGLACYVLSAAFWCCILLPVLLLRSPSPPAPAAAAGSMCWPPCASPACWRLPWPRKASLQHKLFFHACVQAHLFLDCAGSFASLPAALPPTIAGLLSYVGCAAGGGHIVSVGSVAGLKGVADEGSYAATKWAVRGFSGSCHEVGAARLPTLPARSRWGRPCCWGWGSRPCGQQPLSLAERQARHAVDSCLPGQPPRPPSVAAAGAAGAGHQGLPDRALTHRHRHGHGPGGTCRSLQMVVFVCVPSRWNARAASRWLGLLWLPRPLCGA